jgi:hypothetical protein
MKDSNWHRGIPLHKECEWKQGESARAGKNLSKKGRREGERCVVE